MPINVYIFIKILHFRPIPKLNITCYTTAITKTCGANYTSPLIDVTRTLYNLLYWGHSSYPCITTVRTSSHRVHTSQHTMPTSHSRNPRMSSVSTPHTKPSKSQCILLYFFKRCSNCSSGQKDKFLQNDQPEQLYNFCFILASACFASFGSSLYNFWNYFLGQGSLMRVQYPKCAEFNPI